MNKPTKNWKKVPGLGSEQKITANPLHIYFDGRRGNYYRRDDSSSFIIQKEGGIRRFLKSRGFLDNKADDGGLSPLGQAMEEIERKFAVDHVGSVAGYRSGYYAMGNHRVLVTRSPNFIAPEKGEWQHLKVFFESLLGERAEWYYGWLSHTVKALYAGRYCVGQAVVVAGEPACGKTLLATLVTKILGGRSGSAMSFLAGATDFNSELAESEHLVIDDDVSDSSPKTRRRLGAKIRNFVAARSQRIHPKGRQAIELRPFWRLSILMNSDPTSLSVLPQMEDSLADKISLLHASQAVFPVRDNDPEREDRMWRCFSGELPAFVYYLINEHKIKDEWADARFGIKATHDPRVMGLLEPPLENELLGLIDEYWSHLIWAMPDGSSVYEGLARQIESLLREQVDNVCASRLFYGTNVCGLLLRKLSDKMPNRVQSRVLNGNTLWKIMPARE